MVSRFDFHQSEPSGRPDKLDGEESLGIMRVILAFSMKEGTPWIWMIVSGSITLLVGLIVLRRWPFSILFVLGLFLDIDLVIAGATWIGVGLGLKERAS